MSVTFLVSAAAWAVMGCFVIRWLWRAASKPTDTVDAHADKATRIVSADGHTEQGRRDREWLLHPAGGDLGQLDKHLDHADRSIRGTQHGGRSR